MAASKALIGPGIIRKKPRVPHPADLKRPTVFQKLAAEAVGTFFVTLIPIGVDVLYFQGAHIDSVSRWLARGFITIAMIYSFAEVSGAHINPAVSIGFALRGVLPAKWVAPYIGAQFAGGFAAAGLASLLWGRAVALGASHPSAPYSDVQAVLAEIVLTLLLMYVIISTSDQEATVGKNAALAVGLCVAACGFVGGPVSGASMNPARSIPPQILGGVGHLWWIYAVGPCVGAAIACAAAFAILGAPHASERRAGHGT